MIVTFNGGAHMMLRGQFCACLILTLSLMLIGCQGGGVPTAPDTDTPMVTGNGNGDSTSDMRTPALLTRGHNLLALVEVQINATDGTIDVVPLHTAEQHLNLIMLIPIYCHPPSACLDFINLDINMDTAVCDLDVVVTHPVPIAFADVYDLRGVGIFKSTQDPGFSGGTISTQLLNGDGFTTAYDESGYYDAFMNPYIAFNKGEPRRIFEHQSQTIEHFTCQFPSLEPEDSKFLYALDASWSDPDFIDPDDPLTDPNLPDPYEVNILYIDAVSDEAAGEGTAIVEVFDWQANCAAAAIECPALFSASVVMTEAWSSDDGRYLYYAQVVNDNAAAPGLYKLLTMAEDELGSGPDLVDPSIIIDYTNYQLANLTVYDSLLNTRPVADVVADMLFITPGQSVHFDATGSTDTEDGTPTSFLWDLDGDGEFDDGITDEIDKQFDENGTFPVNVMVTDSGGLTDIRDLPLIVHVSPTQNTPPVAYAEASKTNPALDEEITLDASGSTDAEDGKPQSWAWDLDNDLAYDDAEGETIDYSWDTEGVYEVDVLVIDSGGLGDTLNEKIEVTVSGTNLLPTAVATADKTNVVVGEEIIFDGTGSSDPEDGEITQFYWDLFGNKTYDSAYQGMVAHKYWEPGTFEVDLKVVDSQGGEDYLDVPITIEVTGDPNQAPVAIATADKTVVFIDEPIHFDGSDSYDPEEGNVAQYMWDLNGDGAYFDAFMAEVDWFYDTPGMYQVDLMVCDTPGLCDTLDITIEIQVLEGSNHPPVAVAVADKTYVFEGDTVQFDGGDSYDQEDGFPTSWQWDLDDDGEYDDSPFILASRQFDFEGTWYVDLKVTDSEGAYDTLDEKIEITVLPAGSNFPPEAKATISCNTPATGQLVIFDDSSIDSDGTIVSWEWDFDDGNGWVDYTATEGDAEFVFSTEGVFSVDLRVVDDLGVPDQLDAPYTVLVSKPVFTPPTGNPPCDGAKTHFYQIAAPLLVEEMVNTSYAPDVAYIPNGTIIMVVADKLFQVQPPSFVMPIALIEDASWINSIDATQSNLLAVAGLETGIVQMYAVTGEFEVALQFLQEIDVGEPIQAVVFDTNDNLYVYASGVIHIYRPTMYETSPCDTWFVSEIQDYGDVDDMEFSVWNHSLYVVVNDGAGGTVVEVDNVGNVANVLTSVLDGPSNHMDIIIDNSVFDPDTAGCRIEIFGGTNTTYITRVDANLNVLSKSSYGYWGCRAVALDEWMTDSIIVLEDCCYGWVDMLSPPDDWMDFGG